MSLASTVVDALRAGQSVWDKEKSLIKIIHEFKERGYEQEDVYHLLMLVAHRLEGYGQAESAEIVTNVSDYVGGFCSPHTRIWQDVDEMESAFAAYEKKGQWPSR